MATILVTGGAGYVGSHACKLLAAGGHRPVVFDSLDTGRRAAVRWGPLEVGDLRDRAALHAAFAAHRPDGVIHFAAADDAEAALQWPEQTYAGTVGGALSLLQVMRAHGVRTLVFSGTCAVYGPPQATPVPEDHPLAPEDPCGAAAMMVERMLADAGRAWGLRWAALRYDVAAGADPDGEAGERHAPGADPVARAVRAALGTGPAFRLSGTDHPTPDGTAVRDCLHVCDAAAAHVRAAGLLLAGGRSFAANLGSGRGTSERAVLEAVERLSGRPVPVTDGGRRAGGPSPLLARADLARELLGWRPRLSDVETMVLTAVRRHGAVER